MCIDNCVLYRKYTKLVILLIFMHKFKMTFNMKQRDIFLKHNSKFNIKINPKN